MVYSNTRYDNRQADFPEPPLWLTWQGNGRYDNDAQGTVRHHSSLQGARKYVGRYRYAGQFWGDWAIYKWTGKKYTKLYEGYKTDDPSTHPLFRKKIKDLDSAPEREADEEELEAAIQSILGGPDGALGRSM